MKKILLLFAVLFSFYVNAQYAVMWAIDLNDGAEDDYVKLEEFYSEIHKEAVKQGLRYGWSVWKSTPLSLVIWPISLIGLRVQISLFPAIKETRIVSSRIVSSNCFRSIQPYLSTLRKVISYPFCSKALQGSITALCSIGLEIICFPFSL